MVFDLLRIHPDGHRLCRYRPLRYAVPLSRKAGGFHIEKISLKIKELLEGQVLAILEERFESSEKGMETFCQGVLETDKAD